MKVMGGFLFFFAACVDLPFLVVSYRFSSYIKNEGRKDKGGK